MKNKKTLTIIGSIVLITIIVILTFNIFNNKTVSSTSEDNNSTSQIDREIVKDSDWDVSYGEDAVVITLDSNSITSSSNDGISINGNTVTIKEKGDYVISGTHEDAKIIVDAPDENVHIVLDNVNITSKTGSVIYVKNANKVIITNKECTTNKVSDTSNYTFTSTETEPNATIFSHDDLVINGTGTLEVNALYEDAIASKDDLVLLSSTLTINAKDDGIRGKDSVNIDSATINIDSTNSAIKTTNDTDEARGTITIDNSNIIIESDAKGLNATNVITINSGNITINSKDDAINSDTEVYINGGTLTLDSDEDGIHANNILTINDGTIDITNSYEGLEAEAITINGGTTTVKASDDGVNATSGSTSTDANMQGHGNMSSSNAKLVINGGVLKVNAQGDGLDANGSITMTSGEVYVDGPTNNGNGGLDYDGTFNISGGNLVVVSSAGMAQAPSNTSTQYSVQFVLSSNISASSKVELKDESGNVISSYTAAKSFQSVVFSNSQIQNNKTYDLYINNEKVSSITTTGITTSNGNTGGMNNRSNDQQNRPR